MNEDLKKDYDRSVEFWDKNFELSKEQIQDVISQVPEEDDWKQLATSPKLFEALKEFKDCDRLLDYGCGYGWASIIAAKHGCKSVVAVDVVESSKTATDVEAKVFGVSDKIDCRFVSTDWLSKEPEESYDGLFISNVIDVIPMEITRDILANAKRVLKKGAKIVIGMNNYLSPEIAKSKDYTVKEDRYLFVDKILRLVLMSDEEGTSLLSEYFTVTKLDHFSWPGEETETRRLFFLQNE